MKLNYALTGEGEPRDENVNLLISVEGRYSEVIQVLDGARLAYEEVAEDQREQLRRSLQRLGR